MTEKNNNNFPPLRVDVALDHHPSVLNTLHEKALRVPETLGGALLNVALDSQNGVYRCLAAVQDVRKALLAEAGPIVLDSKHRPKSGNARMGPNGWEAAIDDEQLRTGIDAAFNKLAPRLETNLKTLTTQRAEIARRVENQITHPDAKTPTGIALAAEVRGHVKALSKAQRVQFVLQAIEAGDKATATAVLSGPAYLSGLEPAALEMVRSSAAAKFAPVDHAQAVAADKVIAHVQRSQDSFVKTIAQLRPRENPKADKRHDAVKRLAEV
jgi:hypothetical protein